MYWRYALIGLIAIGLAVPASAEFYRYKDENGVLRYTDTYMDIPIEQRRGVTPFIETEGDSISEQAAEKESVERASPGKTPAETQAAKQLESRTMLTEKKQELDRSYAQLLKERKTLAEEKETISMSDPAQAAAYRDKVIDFNQRLKIYQKQVEAFSQAAEAFNKQALAAGAAAK